MQTIGLIGLGKMGGNMAVRYLEAGVGGALGLDLLQDQTLQDLLAQNVLRRQLQFLGAQPLAHGGHLVIELAVEYHAVVHHGSYPVEHHATGGELAGLGPCQSLSLQGQ